MSKKRRTNAEKFDLDRITASVKSSEQYHANIRHHVAALRREVNIEKMLKEKAKLTEDEAISLAALRYGIKALLILKEVLQHIPSNITRVYARGIAMRLAYIHKMFNAWAPTSLNEDELNSLCSFLEAYCPDFLKSQLSAEKSEKAWELIRQEGIHFNKFLTPPVSNCLQCDTQLTMHNNPSKATLFTRDGPIPCSKISLECRDCSIRYGVANFTNEQGSHFYPQDLAIDFIEVSNVTYVDTKLYRWIPSLRYAKFVMFYLLVIQIINICISQSKCH